MLAGSWHAVCRSWKLSRLHDSITAASAPISAEALPALLADALCIGQRDAEVMATQVVRMYGPGGTALATAGGASAAAAPPASGEQQQQALHASAADAIDLNLFLMNERASLKLAVQLLMARLVPPETPPSAVFPAANSLIAQSFCTTQLPCEVRVTGSGALGEQYLSDGFTISMLLEYFLGRISTFEERRALYFAILKNGSGQGTMASSSDGAANVVTMSALAGASLWTSAPSSIVPMAVGGTRGQGGGANCAAGSGVPLISMTGFVAEALNFAINDLLLGSGGELSDDVQSNSILTPPRDARTGTPTSQVDELELNPSAATMMYASANPPPAGTPTAAGSAGIEARREGFAATPESPAMRPATNSDDAFVGFAERRNERCSATSPIMVEPLQIDESASEGHRRFALAESVLRKGQLGASWDEAVSLFERAATQLSFDGLHLLAGHAFVRCADCRLHLSDADQMSAYFVSAARAYARVDHREAIAAFSVAIDSYRALGRTSKVAKLTRELGELRWRVGLSVAALADLVAAGQMLGSLGLRTECRNALSRAVELALVELTDVARAITILEEMYSHSTQAEQPLVLAKAILCRLVCVPPEYSADFFDAMVDVEKTFNSYSDACPNMLRAPECVLVESLLAATRSGNEDAAEEAIGKYLVAHNTEPWFREVLRQAHANILAKKGTMDKLYKIGDVVQQ